MNVRTKTLGMSLIEILLTIAVLSILLGIGAFNLNRYMQASRLNEASKVMGESLRQVSELALSESQWMVVTLSGNTLSWKEKATNQARGNQTLPYNVTISNKSSNSIEFTGRGLPLSDETFEIKLGDKTQKVYLFVTGAVSYP